MNKQIITGLGLASILLFSGCATSTSSSTTLNNQIKVVRKSGSYYYYVTANSIGGHLDKKWAYLNRVTSSGVLQCREHDAWGTTQKGSIKSDEVNRQYTNILTPAEKKKLATHPTVIPKQDSKEFQNIVKVETELAKTGQSYCAHPMSKAEVKKYKAFVNNVN